MKVFWSNVTVDEAADGYTIVLDTRPLKTPGRAPLTVPKRALADALADEWRAQKDEVDPASLPLTKAVNSTIDRVALAFDDVAAEIAGFGGTDLLCYRAPHPKALAERQADAWDPILAWASTDLRAPLILTEGVMHIPQPEPSLIALQRQVTALSPWQLTALHSLVTLSGSLILGLAVQHRRLSAQDAWKLSRIDEDWNAEEWGADEEAARLTALKQAEFIEADRLLHLLDAT